MMGNLSTRTLTAGILLAMSFSTGPRVLAQEESPSLAIEWLSFREAKSQARDQDKPVLVHFTAPWCQGCKQMKKETYTDPQVIRYVAENFKASMVDVEKLPSLARKYDVDSMPTLWFLDASGKALTSIEGIVGPEKLLRVLEFIGTKAYEETDYNSWLHSRKSR